MFTLVTHCIYAVVILYVYKGVETYRSQIALGVTKKKAVLSGLIWPKYIFK